MNEKLKKALSYIGTFIAGIVSLLLYFKYSKRYREVKAELSATSKAIHDIEYELGAVEREQLISKDASQRIRENLDRERDIIGRVGAILTDNDDILSECKGKLDFCNALIRESELLIES